MRRFFRAATPAGVVLIGAGLVCTLGRGGDWSTGGNDAQRSSWVRSDPKISLATVEKPGFQMIWKVKLGEGRTESPLTDATLLNFYIGYRGFRSFAFLGSRSNGVYAVDTDLSRIEWARHLSGGGSSPCEAASITRLSRPTELEIAMAGGGGPKGRSSYARGAVGEPGQGAPNLVQAAVRQPAAPRPSAPAPTPRKAARGAIPNPFRPGRNFLYALTGDGLLHQMYVSNGQEPEPPFRFLPPKANPSGLIIVGNMAYVVTRKGCGGVPEGVWALDLESKKVARWKGPVAGPEGIAFDPDGTLYVATGSDSSTHGDSLVALDPETLEPRDWYDAGSAFASSPVIFAYKDKILAAAATTDGRLHLVDTKSLGGANHKTPLARADARSKAAGSALASWEDPQHTRWILASAANAIVAWKVVDANGAPALDSGWVSREMTSPLPPMVLNDVVFALDGGNPSVPAVLYALDPSTGKEVWNSGRSIASYVPTGGLSAGGSQLYLGAADGALYAFGFPMEH